MLPKMIRLSSNPARLNLIRSKKKGCLAVLLTQSMQTTKNFLFVPYCGVEPLSPRRQCCFLSCLKLWLTTWAMAQRYLIAPQRTGSIDVLHRYCTEHCIPVPTQQISTLSRVTQMFGKAEFQQMKEHLMFSKIKKVPKHFLTTPLCSCDMPLPVKNSTDYSNMFQPVSATQWGALQWPESLLPETL